MTPQDLATVLREATELATYYASLGDMPVDLGSRLAFARAVLHLSAALRAPLPEALAAIEARAEAATPGTGPGSTWLIEREELSDDFSDEEQATAYPARIGPIESWEHEKINTDGRDGFDQIEADAALIQHARVDELLLLAGVRAQAAIIRERDAEIARLRSLAEADAEGWRLLDAERIETRRLRAELDEYRVYSRASKDG